MTNLKAYITIMKKHEIKRMIVTLDEAKQLLTAKQFEKLTSFEGLHTRNITGYVA